MPWQPDRVRTIRLSWWIITSSSVVLVFVASVARAQPFQRTVPIEEQIRIEMEQSRFHLGPLRLQPKFALTNAGYNNNLFGTPEPTVSDYTATVSAGLHMIVPFGTKMYVRGDVSPEYYWYAHHVDQRQLGGRYAASWLGLFNWSSSELSGSYWKSVARLSSENETFVTQTFSDGIGRLEVNLSRRWSLFVGVDGHRLRYSSPVLIRAQELDRDEYAGRAGIRYRLTSFFNVAALVQGGRTEFVTTSRGKDNQTEAYLVEGHYDRGRFFLTLSAGYQRAQPYLGSTFTPFSTGTGSYLVSYTLVAPIEFQAYGHRAPQYSLFSSNAYFIETRNGLALNLKVGHRIRLHGYGAFGTNKYPLPFPVHVTEFVQRKDRSTSVGGGLTLLFFRNATVLALVDQTKLSSNIPGLGRSILRFTTNLTFEGAYTR